MPQKKNPDILELTRGKTARVIGNLVAILSNLKGLASGYGRDLQEIKPSVFLSSRTAISALVVLNSMFATLKVNKQKMNQIADSGYLSALDIAEALVKEGLPFRTAHKIVGRLVQIAHESKISLSELTASEVARSVSGKEFDAKKLGKIISSINVQSSLKNRSSLGSAGISEQNRLIAKRKSKIRQYQKNVTKRSAQITSAIQKLSSQVKSLSR
jgi:argininosuccinate lyase